MQEFEFEEWLPLRKDARPRTPRRSPVEIIFALLRVISENQPVRPTRVMNLANLSWTVMESYVKQLKDRELVEGFHARYDGRELPPGGECWSFLRLTPKGLRALSSFNEAMLTIGSKQD